MKLFNRILFFVNGLILRMKKNRKIKFKDDNIKINLGCGLTVGKDWKNIDGSLSSVISVMPKFIKKIAYHLTGAKNSYTLDEYINILSKNCFIHHDLRTGIPMHDAVSSYVFSSHFFEHLYPDDAKVLLKDAYRVLKKGGRLRLSIPDLEFAIGLYPENKERMLKNYFFINNISNNFSNHKFMYDYDMIKSILIDIGFVDILKSSYKGSNFPDVEILDNRGEDSLFVEAIK